MKYFKIALLVLGYAILGLIVLAQLLSIAVSQSTKETLIRLVFVFAIAMFFAIRWQKRNKRKDDAE